MSRLNEFEYTMSSCNHCGQCKWILPSRMHGWDFSEICPIYKHYGFELTGDELVPATPVTHCATVRNVK